MTHDKTEGAFFVRWRPCLAHRFLLDTLLLMRTIVDHRQSYLSKFSWQLSMVRTHAHISKLTQAPSLQRT
jgi:hypothetical protein